MQPAGAAGGTRLDRAQECGGDGDARPVLLTENALLEGSGRGWVVAAGGEGGGVVVDKALREGGAAVMGGGVADGGEGLPARRRRELEEGEPAALLEEDVGLHLKVTCTVHTCTSTSRR